MSYGEIIQIDLLKEACPGGGGSDLSMTQTSEEGHAAF